MRRGLESITWPLSSVGLALEALAKRSGFLPKSPETIVPPRDLNREDSLGQGRWIEAAARWLGVEAEPVSTTYAQVDRFLSRVGPALLRLPGDHDPRFLALLRGARRTVLVLCPDLSTRRIPTTVVRKALCQALEQPFFLETDRLLEEASVPAARRETARAALIGQRLGTVALEGCWLLRPSPGSSFWLQAKQARLPRRLMLLACAHTVQYVLWILSWWVVGRAALQGRIDGGWLMAWALLLVTLIPFQVLSTWLQGLLAIGAGALLKARLLYGALRLEPEEIRHQGAGQLLGRVIESEAVESLALSGGALGLVAFIELVIAAGILATVTPLLALLLLGWTALALSLGWRYFRRRQRWTDVRLAMTHDLVERMVGHRTRLAQELRERWHSGEDQMVARHLELSSRMDRDGTWLTGLVPRGWLVLGILGVAPHFIEGRSSPVTIAIAVGTMLLSYRALRRLAVGLWQIAGAAIAWDQAAPIFHAARRSEPAASPALALPDSHRPADGHQPIIAAHELTFRYPDRAQPALDGCTLRISAGDRILVEGPSGSGKSTLASLLTGVRAAQSGLLLFGGLDPQTLGLDFWRRHATSVPQFHENYVLTGPFAFNVLMGGRWPAPPEDFERAEIVCRELGLGDLLSRMPAGLLQAVGESGWQLSHGERSRLYIARALLQDSPVVVLDESFGQLDPENLERSVRCVLNRTSTVLVIAHP